MKLEWLLICLTIIISIQTIYSFFEERYKNWKKRIKVKAYMADTNGVLIVGHSSDIKRDKSFWQTLAISVVNGEDENIYPTGFVFLTEDKNNCGFGEFVRIGEKLIIPSKCSELFTISVNLYEKTRGYRYAGIFLKDGRKIVCKIK